MAAMQLQGAAGVIEAVLDEPDADKFPNPQGTAVIAHPHPLFGGTMENKVVQTLSRAFLQSGWRTVRFNFRGVGVHHQYHGRYRLSHRRRCIIALLNLQGRHL